MDTDKSPPWKESPHKSSENKKPIMLCEWEEATTKFDISQTFEAHSIVTF